MIIGVGFHPVVSTNCSMDSDSGEFQENGWRTARKRRTSIALWRLRATRCALAWRPAGTHAGSNDGSLRCTLSYGSETQQRYGPASTKTKDRSARCTADSETHAAE